ncbi:hypothetical protein MWU52_16385 [Jannaschia sp. S6380]|uniref:hypothetical protein n=1 Tax=Jannaschia sp. S6380 TaxID=2926408 RepID=UPI001FF42F6D|nr:hypothetical protein [Jannaschia sp. S6380]MCK0169134.1 hypothetical protein [Jannaschia sp. S6380]
MTRWVLTLAAAVLSVGLAGRAEAAWEAAVLSGSDRLFLYSLLRDRPAGYRPEALRLVRRLALSKKGGRPAFVAQRSFDLTPALDWDENVNGGTAADTLTLSGLRFTVDDGSRARAGFVAGIDAGAGIAFAVASRVRLSFDAHLSLRHAPELDLNDARGGLRACAERGNLDWSAWRGCVGVSGRERALSSSAVRSAEIERIGLFSSGLGDHEWRAGIWWNTDGETVRRGVQGTFLTANDRVGLVSLTATAGSDVLGGTAALSRRVAGAPTRFSVGHLRQTGTPLLGERRKDRVLTAGVTRPVGKHFRTGLRWTRRRSTIEGFDSSGLRLDVGFRGWRW